MSKKTILVVLGTRPEVIKLAPVILELRKRPDLYHTLICNTEQQKQLSNQTLAFFGLDSDIHLDVMSENQTLSGVQAKISTRLEEIYATYKIDATIVQGDTITAFCGALISFYHRIPIFHVEAGLRSYHLFEPYPEEAMRQMTARIADMHFAPTLKAQKALLQENIAAEKIHLTGNTVIDALTCLSSVTLETAVASLRKYGIRLDDKLVLVTVHRRENHGERLERILQALQTLAMRYEDHQFIIPVHPNPNVHDQVLRALSNIPNVVLTKPLDYPELVSLMKSTKLVLTDSGGIQEEAPTFGNPVLVMRYETERTEGVEAGFAKLVGADIAKIISEADAILARHKIETRKDGSKNPYGDGHASERICTHIQEFMHHS